MSCELPSLPSKASRKWRHRVAFPLMCLIFFLVRLNILLADPLPGSDVPTYAKYMFEQERANQEGITLYEYHTRETRRKLKVLRDQGKDTADFDDYEYIEYPPLAIEFLRLPTLAMRPIADEKKGKRNWWEPSSREAYTEEYVFYFPFWIALTDIALCILVVLIQYRVFSGAETSQRLLPLAIYILSTAILWPLLFQRLDLLLALLISSSFLLLVARLHYFWSFAVLAAAINFKLVPIVLAPVWLLGSLPANTTMSLRDRPFLQALLVRGAMLVALVVGLFIVFYVCYGPETLGFFVYHQRRGLEVGSLPSSWLMVVGTLGHPIEIYFSHGGHNLRSPWSPFLVGAAPLLAGFLLLAATARLFACLAGCRAASRSDGASATLTPTPAAAAFDDATTLAQARPLVLGQFTLLFLMLFIVSNKVFSPQYLLWLSPFMVLLPWRDWRQWFFLAVFLAICALSTVLFPFVFWSDVVGGAYEADGTRTFDGPTPLGVVLLATRNLLFLGLALWLLWGAGREG